MSPQPYFFDADFYDAHYICLNIIGIIKISVKKLKSRDNKTMSNKFIYTFPAIDFVASPLCEIPFSFE